MGETASLAPAEGGRYCALKCFVSDDWSKTCNSCGIRCHAGVLPYLPVFQHGFYGFTTTWPLCVTVWRHLSWNVNSVTQLWGISGSLQGVLTWDDMEAGHHVDVDISWFTPVNLEHLRAWLCNNVCVCAYVCSSFHRKDQVEPGF